MSQAKPFVISKWQVMRAFELVKANAGAAGIDQQTLAEYEGNLQDKDIADHCPNLFAHWRVGMIGAFA